MLPIVAFAHAREMELVKPPSGMLPALDSPGTTLPKLCFFPRLRTRMEPRLGHSSRPRGQDSNSTLMNGWMPMSVSCRMSPSPKRRCDKVYPQLSPAQLPTIITAVRAAQSPGKSKQQKKSRATTVLVAQLPGVAFVLGASVSPGHAGQCLFRMMSQILSKSLSLLAPLTCRLR